MPDTNSKRLQLLGAFPAPSDEQVKNAVAEHMAENPDQYTGPAGLNGYSIFYSSEVVPDSEPTMDFHRDFIVTYGRTIQIGDMIASNNGDLYRVTDGNVEYVKGELILNGLRGPQGTPGKDYVLTDADKVELVSMVLSNFTNVAEVGA